MAEKGEGCFQEIGINRGGRNSKLHALTDDEGRPLHFLLTGGNVADRQVADALLDNLAPITIVLADKAYAAMPPRPDRAPGRGSQHPIQGQPALEKLLIQDLYMGRNAVERMFCRLKDYRRIAARYDKLATNFLSAIYLAAAVTWWI